MFCVVRKDKEASIYGNLNIDGSHAILSDAEGVTLAEMKEVRVNWLSKDTMVLSGMEPIIDDMYRCRIWEVRRSPRQTGPEKLLNKVLAN